MIQSWSNRSSRRLRLLAFAESRFTERGKGPWQFNTSTAKIYGLDINRWVDERRDPILSTKAAAEYLAELHDAADHDWRVAVIGWNMGAAYLDRYWLLEGTNYKSSSTGCRAAPASCCIVSWRSHSSRTTPLPMESTKRTSRNPLQGTSGQRRLHLADVAKRFHTSIARLRELNPALLTNVVPPYATTYPIRVPVAHPMETASSSPGI